MKGAKLVAMLQIAAGHDRWVRRPGASVLHWGRTLQRAANHWKARPIVALRKHTC